LLGDVVSLTLLTENKAVQPFMRRQVKQDTLTSLDTLTP
jgi:hypothetical protein